VIHCFKLIITILIKHIYLIILLYEILL